MAKDQKKAKKNKKKGLKTNSLRNPTHRDYRLYIKRICKKKRRDPHTRMSSNYTRVTNSVLNHCFERVAFRAKQICRARGVQTLKAKHIEKAVCLELPSQVAERAVMRMREAASLLKLVASHQELATLH